VSAAFLVYTADEKKPDLITPDMSVAVARFIREVFEGDAEHVRLDYSS
jgi:hypothetical protein